MLPGKGIKPRSKEVTKSELGFRCLGVGLFLYFIFFFVPQLGSPSCKTALDRDLETLQDLQDFLQQLAEEHKHDAEKAKHLLSLAQQLGGGRMSPAASPANTTNPQQQPHHAADNSTAAAQQSLPGAALAQQLLQSQADLATAKKVIRKHEQLLQAQLQEATKLRAELQQQQQQQTIGSPPAAAASIPGGPTPSTASSCSATAVQAMAIRGDACGVLQSVELGGDVVIWGSEHKTRTAAECCAACLAHSRAIHRGVGHDHGSAAKACNVWVHCSDAQACGERLGECWLKFDPEAPAAASRAAAVDSSSSGGSQPPTMWTSGAPQQDRSAADFEAARLGVSVDWLSPSLTSTPTAAAAPVLVWSTGFGQIRVRLRPDLAPGSVRELVRMAVLLTQHGGGLCSNCRIYRAEPGFLVQGVLEAAGAYVAVPRHPNPPQPKMMPRGMLCWAGGGGGPDWFVNMVDQGGFADQHLCFGQVDESSLAVFQRIVQLPVQPRGPANSVEMMVLQQPVRFTVTLEHQ